MHGFKLFFIITVSCFFSSAALADIYEWTDADGIKHYSNYAPPENSRILMQTKEEPYDEAADRARAETERQARLEADRLEIALREADLEQREAEAERRLAEADRLAEETLSDAESYLRAAENSRPNFSSGGYGCYDACYGCSDTRLGRWYYRNETGSIFFKKPAYATPYRHYRHTKRYDAHYRNDFRSKSRHNIHARPQAPHHKIYRPSHRSGLSGSGRIGTRSGSIHGRAGLSGSVSGIGRRP